MNLQNLNEEELLNLIIDLDRIKELAESALFSRRRSEKTVENNSCRDREKRLIYSYSCPE